MLKDRWFHLSVGFQYRTEEKNNAFRILELTTCRACFSFNESMVEDWRMPPYLAQTTSIQQKVRQIRFKVVCFLIMFMLRSFNLLLLFCLILFVGYLVFSVLLISSFVVFSCLCFFIYFMLLCFSIVFLLFVFLSFAHYCFFLSFFSSILYFVVWRLFLCGGFPIFLILFCSSSYTLNWYNKNEKTKKHEK